jgi:cytochrome o ubiquinol oxidase subunit 1
MTTIDPKVAAAVGTASAAGERAHERTGNVATALADWLTSTDHKKIGRMFIGAALACGLAVIGIAGLLGIERIDATGNTVSTGSLPQLFSLYRLVLTFGVVAPLLLGLAVAIVPLQLGARAIAFPRLAAAGFWTWLIGVGLVVGSIAANGGPGGGSARMVDLFLVSHVLVVFGLVAAAVSVATSVLTTRAPGMNMRRVPVFAWSALVGSLGLILMLPVLAGALVLLYLDHRGARTTFGGNTGVGSWIRFAVTQPQTFVYVVPAFGIMIEVIATATRSRLKLRGVALTGLGLVGLGAIAGVSQVSAVIRPDVRHLAAGQVFNDVAPYALFNLVPLLGAVMVFAVCLLALATSRPKIGAALMFGFFGAGLIVMGVAANAVFLVGDAKLAGTVFEEGAWVAVCYGGVLTALGGVLHWGPKLWGRRASDARAIPLALLGALGTLLASAPYLIAGFAKQPTESTIFHYSGPQGMWNGLATAGHALMLVTLVGFIGVAIGSFTGDQSNAAGDDPWDGQTLEWATSSPAPADNFAAIHTVASATPLLDLKTEPSPDLAATSGGAT